MRTLRLLFLTIAPLCAAATFTSETIFDWRTPSTPQISPDGRRVVYTLETADRFADAFYSNLRHPDLQGNYIEPIS